MLCVSDDYKSLDIANILIIYEKRDFYKVKVILFILK